MAEKPPSLLKKFKFPVTTLNKKLIVTLVALLVMAVLAIMISALTTSPQSTRAIQGIDAPATSIAGAPPADVSSLPNSYRDAAQINKILDRDTDGMSPAALEKINTIQAEEQQLQAQLLKLTQQRSMPMENFSQEAASSSIFFAGGAPPTANTPAAAPADEAKKDASADAAKNAGSTYDPYAQQNNQTQKLDFLTSQPSKDIYNPNTVQYPASQYILQAGSVIPGNLITTIVTNLPGVVTASVSQNVYDSITGKYLLIPRGSKLIGEYNSNVTFGQTQVQIKFTRLIRPDGTSIVLPSEGGVDSMGVTGLTDDINNHWGKIIGAASLSALFNLPGIIAQNQMNNSPAICTTDTLPGGTTSCTGPSTSKVASASALQSAGNSASQVGDQIATQSLNIQPEITIHSGFQFSIMVTKDIVLPPYPEAAR